MPFGHLIGKEAEWPQNQVSMNDKIIIASPAEKLLRVIFTQELWYPYSKV
jgi:hypothetical protein